MSVPAVKENFINFIVKLVLVFTLIGCGVVLLFYQNNSTKYIAQKQQRIASLIDLKGALEQTDYAYLKIKNGDSTLGDSLKINLKILSEKKKALLLFTQQNELYKNNALAVKSSLEEEESFYTAQLNSFSPGSDNVQIDSSNKIGRTQPLLTALINLERDELSQKISQNDSLYTILGYLVVGVGALVLLMVVIINNRFEKGLQKQVTHERDIYNAKLMAQAANNAKTEYLGMISHEIRTPMNGVLGMSNLLLQSSLNTEQKEYAKTIHDSAETLLRIVNDILDFSKIEGGKLHLDKSSVNIRELIEDAFAHFPKSKEGVDISYKVDPNVPNSIYCDPKRLKQILLNFLGNAIKFTEKGSVVLECTLIDKDEHGAMRLGFVIKDTGIGIAESRIKSLFNPFVQTDYSTMRKYGGTGLGLNIAYNLIAMMDGKIKVKSEVGVGSTFTFFVVVKETAEKQVPKEVKEPKKEKEVKEVKEINPILDNELSASYPFKILVVDDNEINLMLITKTLSKLGYDCQKASNGQIAVDMVKENQFDLIFMDMQMPIMDGTVATTEIRKHYRIYGYPIVIALTANTLGDGKERCLEAGMQDFIAKPFKPAEIESIIKKWAPKIIEHKRKDQSISLS